ncbi:MAG: inorganic pyrophosphatase, partial [Actinobacteria bacterium]|nr:inorganic pyrophosphatase [Actinomycetota bacterium]
SLEPNKAVHGGDWVDQLAAEAEITASYQRYQA